MPNPFKRKKRRYRLSKPGRAALRASCQTHRPWQHSTGPRTPEGKQMTGQNNLRHGYYCQAQQFEDAPAFHAFSRKLRRESNQSPKRKIGPPVVEEE
jgi:hypothetical protein